MARVKNVYKAMEKLKIKDAYCMCVSNMEEITGHAKGYYDAMYDSFRFGYLQGMKAAKAEMKRGVVA